MATVAEKIHKKVARLKKQEDFATLGEMFFRGFVTLKKNDPERTALEKEWDALSATEKELCEGV